MRADSYGQQHCNVLRSPQQGKQPLSGHSDPCLHAKSLLVASGREFVSADAHAFLGAIQDPAAGLVEADRPRVFRHNPQRRDRKAEGSHRALSRRHERSADAEAALVGVDHDGHELARRPLVAIGITSGTHRDEPDDALAMLR